MAIKGGSIYAIAHKEGKVNVVELNNPLGQ